MIKNDMKETAGKVALIGCGPGDPGLMTLKAAAWLSRADVVVTDRLVNPEILAMAKAGAAIIDAGKEPRGQAMAQDEINRILVREALKGQWVARLKGGDGFVFGRAAEEMAALGAAGIEVEVIPGITAAHACAASVGLPLTLRASIRQFSIVTGATREGLAELDWEALSRPGQAFAIYMGVGTAAAFKAKLLSAGADPDTPVVIVENGTLPSERAIAARLADVSRALAFYDISGPAIIFTGLSWEAANLSMPGRVETYRHVARPGQDAGSTETMTRRRA